MASLAQPVKGIIVSKATETIEMLLHTRKSYTWHRLEINHPIKEILM
jgi:hypothetical protein